MMMMKIKNLSIGVRVVGGVLLILGVSLPGIMLWSAAEQKRSAVAEAMHSASGMTDLTLAGLVLAMQSGDPQQVAGFVQQAQKGEGLESLTILRGRAVDEQFGKTSAVPADTVEQAVLNDRRSYQGLEESDGRMLYRSVVPLLASRNVRGHDCLKCHQAREGAVLGAVSIKINLDEVRRATAAFRLKVFGATLLIGGLVTAAIFILLRRTLSQPLGRVVGQLRDISEGEGDLTKRLEVSSGDEIGQLGDCFNIFMDKLYGIIARVRRSAIDLASASQQLSGAGDQLASGTQEQAASLEETAAALEQMTASVKQNVENTQRASDLGAGSRRTAESGGEIVREAVQAMGEISKASNRIMEIVGLIDEIAFQTNLLALNAAVEAARAGEHGRGFAVVASEVRNLAARSASAAKEIKALITDSVQKIEDGVDRVNRSGQTLEDILGSVKGVSDLVNGIAVASEEQYSGIEQVNRAVTQMDQTTQAAAAQTEELSSSAQVVAQQASDLLTLVERFRLDDTAMASVAPSSLERGGSGTGQAWPASRPSSARRKPEAALT